jgi:hypothetical protein
MPKNIDKLTFMESKILELGKKQHEKGYQGGSFTPGFIRKETDYGYRAINVALESLIALELVEKTVSNTFRNGALVELDVYTITGDGIEVLDKVKSGAIALTGKEPVKQAPLVSEPRPYSKPWESSAPREAPKPRYEPRPAPNYEMEHTLKSLEISVRALAEEMRVLRSKVDNLTIRAAAPPPAPAPAPKAAEPVPRKKSKSMDSSAMVHRVMLLKAVSELSAAKRNVLADDVKDKYFADCESRGEKPKGTSQFTPFLKRLESEGLLSLKRVGCKNLGIKGQGSRVVVTVTDTGLALLQK